MKPRTTGRWRFPWRIRILCLSCLISSMQAQDPVVIQSIQIRSNGTELAVAPGQRCRLGIWAKRDAEWNALGKLSSRPGSLPPFFDFGFRKESMYQGGLTIYDYHWNPAGPLVNTVVGTNLPALVDSSPTGEAGFYLFFDYSQEMDALLGKVFHPVSSENFGDGFRIHSTRDNITSNLTHEICRYRYQIEGNHGAYCWVRSDTCGREFNVQEIDIGFLSDYFYFEEADLFPPQETHIIAQGIRLTNRPLKPIASTADFLSDQFIAYGMEQLLANDSVDVLPGVEVCVLEMDVTQQPVSMTYACYNDLFEPVGTEVLSFENFLKETEFFDDHLRFRKLSYFYPVVIVD